jgi:hypothetical protein
MNIFNRLLIIVLDVIMLIAVGLILLVTLGFARPDQLFPSLGLAPFLAPFAGLSGSNFVWTVGVSAALVVVGLILLSLEIRRRAAPVPVMLKRDSLGKLTVSREAATQLIDRAASQVGGVMDARSKVDETSKGVRVRTRITVSPSANLAQVTAEVREAIKSTVEEQLGRPAEGVDVRAHLAALPTTA